MENARSLNNAGVSEHPKVGVGVMIIREGHILFGKRLGSHGSGTYGWAGGHLEYGESFEECAIREVYEETGLQVISLKFLCISNIVEYGKHYVDIEFLGEVSSGEPQVKEPEKVECWEWHPIDKPPSPLFKADELAIRSYQTGHFYNK